jgi:diaminopimelate epimerase
MANETAFAKTQAHGNDFIVVSEDSAPRSEEQRRSFAVSICDRRLGIGGDGLLLYGREGERFTMTVINSDGSFAEISGNGLRCLAAFLTYAGLSTEKELSVSTGAGLLSIEKVSREGPRFRFRADMGSPRDIMKDVALDLGGHELVVTTLSMGNPHAVHFVEHLDVEALRSLGPRVERHARFPNRTNFELVEIQSDHEIRIGIWERGAGETASSGTGSAASAVASMVKGLVSSSVRVHCPGGEIDVDWPARDEVFVTGEAVVVGTGSYLVDWRE